MDEAFNPVAVDPPREMPSPPWDNPCQLAPPEEWFRDERWFELVYNTADTDLRAHRIALTYYHLGRYIDTLIHGGVDCGTRRERTPSEPLNANWFHFAMWGTLTVTQNLTTQRSPQRLNSGIPAPLRRRLTPAILRARASDGQRVGRALAKGQLDIFASATQMVTEFTRRDDLKAVDVNAILGRIEQRPPGLSDVPADAARHLVPAKTAFAYYQAAAKTESAAERAWLLLGGTLLLTTIEQDIADDSVEVVLDHLPAHVGSLIDWRLAKLSERSRGVPPSLAYTVLESMHPNKRKLIYTIWSRLMTDQVLVMALPTETLRLGRDIPPRYRQYPTFPPDLRNLPDAGDDESMIEIVNLVKSVDRTIVNAGTRGSAARDWRRWDERMNWALALIRSRQQDETLFWSPYSVADQWRIVNGEMPERVGDASTLDVQAPMVPKVVRLRTTRDPS